MLYKNSFGQSRSMNTSLNIIQLHTVRLAYILILVTKCKTHTLLHEMREILLLMCKSQFENIYKYTNSIQTSQSCEHMESVIYYIRSTILFIS